jgi:hypothetical protein
MTPRITRLATAGLVWKVRLPWTRSAGTQHHTPHIGVRSGVEIPGMGLFLAFLAFRAADRNGCARLWVSGRRCDWGHCIGPNCTANPPGRVCDIFCPPIAGESNEMRNGECGMRSCYPSNRFCGPIQGGECGVRGGPSRTGAPPPDRFSAPLDYLAFSATAQSQPAREAIYSVPLAATGVA